MYLLFGQMSISMLIISTGNKRLDAIRNLREKIENSLIENELDYKLIQPLTNETNC